MEKNKQLARQSVEALIDLPEDELFRKLGVTINKVGADGTLASDFALSVQTPVPQEQGAADVLGAFGRAYFNRFERQAFNLLCGDDASSEADRDKLSEAFHLTKADAAAAVTAVLIAQLALAPAVATILGALIVKLLFQPALDATCDVWSRRLNPEPAPANA